MSAIIGISIKVALIASRRETWKKHGNAEAASCSA
jgi:hypothetical protein